MTTVIVSLHPKEVDKLKLEIEDMGNPTITLHGMVTLELRTEKPAPQAEPRYVVMAVDRIIDIQAGSGKILGFVRSKDECETILKDSYTLPSKWVWEWDNDSISELNYTLVIPKDMLRFYVYLYPIH